VTFTVSVGIAASARCGDLPTLLARADVAMYEAKRAGGACWRVFDRHGPGAGSDPPDRMTADAEP
jgi:predicted signal transduction protein with EAL and GGDEF domain